MFLLSECGVLGDELVLVQNGLVPSTVSQSCQLTELLLQGCGDRFLTVVDDDTNVDCGRRVLSLSTRRSASRANEQFCGGHGLSLFSSLHSDDQLSHRWTGTHRTCGTGRTTSCCRNVRRPPRNCRGRTRIAASTTRRGNEREGQTYPPGRRVPPLRLSNVKFDTI